MSTRKRQKAQAADEAAADETPAKKAHVQTGDDAVHGRVATAEELQQLDTWNGLEQMDYPDTSCLQDLFWATAKKYPERVALIDGTTEQQWTYAELDALTDKLASWLFNECGVRPGGVVGILLNRSPEFVMAYVAILKAGGAYMPLELSYPKDLLERAIDETDAVLTLTTSEYADRLSPAHKRLLMEDDWLSKLPANLPAMPEGGFQPKPNIDDLAYVVMSSGTTGKPKGIMCPHRCDRCSARCLASAMPPLLLSCAMCAARLTRVVLLLLLLLLLRAGAPCSTTTTARRPFRWRSTTAKVRKTPFWHHFILKTELFYAARLGTNIGKVEKRGVLRRHGNLHDMGMLSTIPERRVRNTHVFCAI
eukprot:COSAG06_NODE_2313_length_7098_cov_7.885412_1_plen_364_part_00